MKNKRLIKHSKEKFLPPRLTQTIGLELEDALLGTSTDVPMTIVDTGHESYTYTTDSYWE